MPDINDVVRHVILRIVVDQAGLAEELAAARAKLKGLKDSEKEINRERGKNTDEVTKAVKAQNDALGENQRAHEAAQRASAGKSSKSADAIRAETDAIKAGTKEREAQTVAEAKADAIKKKSRQDELDRIKERTRAALKGAQEVLQAEQKTQQQIQQTEAARIANTNKRAGGLNDRRNRTTESTARISRLDKDAEERRDKELAEFNASEARKDDKHETDKFQREARHNQDERLKNTAAAAALANRKTESDARAATAAARTAGVEAKNADVNKLASSTYEDRETAVKQVAQGKTQVAQQRTEAATSIADAAETRSQAARDKAASDAKLAKTKEQVAAEKSVSDQQARQVRNQGLIANLKAAAAKATTGQQILEERLAATAERRASAAERELKAARSRRGLVEVAGATFADAAVASIRAVSTSPRRAVTARAPEINSQAESLRRVTTVAGRAETAISQFFRRFTGDGEKSLEKMGAFRAKFTAFVEDINRSRKGGSGGGVLQDLAQNFTALGQKLGSSLSTARKHIFSFQTIIVAAIAALGPLAATLGAVGAAALGLASNLGALAGSLLALPGILGAVIGGFGALALVMKPISSVFSAYTAAQKEATKATDAATKATLALKEAELNRDEAALAHSRAIADVPRAQQKLNESRRQAARDIQDYRLQLQKLKFDEEGASLGVESAELAYRKALVDPTQSNLDRRIARHDVEGALFDQRDQGVAGGRLKEDSAEAFKKGVDGADAVIAAQRGVEDATNDVTASYINWQQAIIAVKKAAGEQKAGGTAAAALQAEIDKLPPKTRKVVEALLKLQSAYKAMRDRLSENIFGPISTDTGKFRDILKSLEDFLGPISEGIGRFAKKALDLFTNPEWKKFFSAQGEESGHIIEKLGDALLSAADGFKTVIEVARPFTRFVVDGIAAAAKGFDDFYNSTELLDTGLTRGETNRKKLAAFLDISKRRIQELWPVIKNLASGFAGFFDALNTAGGGQSDFTTWFNKGLLDASKNFKELGDQARDPNGGFQKWLREVRPLLSQVATFLKNVGTFFGEMFADTKNMQEAQILLREIGTKWLPAIAEIFSKLSESGFISKLAKGISGVFDGINDFLDNGGITALGAFASALEVTGQTISFIAGLIDKLTTAMPFLGTAFKTVGTIIGVFFGAALLARLSGLIPAVIGIGKAVKGVGNIAGSIIDRDRDTSGDKPRGRFGRIFGGIGDAVRDRADRSKDTFLGRNSGESAARRTIRTDERNAAKGRPTTPKPTTPAGTPQLGSRTNTGNVLTTLYRIEKWVEQVAINTRGGAGGRGAAGVDPDGNPKNGPKNGTGSPGGQPARTKYDVADNDPKKSGYGSVGPEVVSPGVDPNSPEGMRQRREAAAAAKQARQDVKSTPTQRNDARATTQIADIERAEKSAARRATRSRIRGRFGGLGASIISGLTTLGGSSPNLANILPTSLPGLANAPSTGALAGPQSYLPDRQVAASYNGPNQGVASPLPGYQQTPARTPRGATPIGPYNYPAGAPVLPDIDAPYLGGSQNVAKPAQQRGPGGRFLPRPTSSAPYDPYVFPDVQAPSQNVAQAPQQRGPNGRFLPRPTGSFNPYDVSGSPGMPAAPSMGLYQGPQRPGPADIDNLGAARPVAKQSRTRRFLNRITGKLGNDEGYLDLGTTPRRGLDLSGDGPLVDDDDDQRRRRRGIDQSDIDLPDGDDSRTRGRRGLGEVEEDTRSRGRLRGRLGGRGGGRLGGAVRGLSSLTRGLGSKLGGLGKLGGKLGGLGKFGGGLLKGAAGGVGGLAASLALSFGGDALINKFVKNDDDANSLSGGLSNVATGAGLGALFGGPVGAAIGGLAGGAYSLATDKNLRGFVGDKLKGGAKAVGGFVKGAGSAISGAAGGLLGGLFGGKDKDDKGGGFSLKGALGGLAGGGLVGAILGGTDIGQAILGSLKKAGKGIGDFFTKDIPRQFNRGIKAITDFFTKTLPSLPGKAFDAITTGIGVLIGFFKYDIPRAAEAAWAGITTFFTETLPSAASAAWAGITGFFTETLPNAANAAWAGITGFFTETLPAAADLVWNSITGFFTETLPHAAGVAWAGITSFFTDTLPKVFNTVVDSISNFFGTTLPNFFTVTLPNAIQSLPGFLLDNLVRPVVDFFSGIGDHIGDALKGGWNAVKGWAQSVFERGSKNVQAGEDSRKPRMSGGLIEGIFQGIEDRAMTPTTPGEFVVRRSKVQEPGAKAFLSDFNEGRVSMSDLYNGLAASVAPQAMSMVPPNAQALTGKVPSVVNTTINHAPVMGDVTIHNPVRERSEHSLRRQVQLANIRHRR